MRGRMAGHAGRVHGLVLSTQARERLQRLVRILTSIETGLQRIAPSCCSVYLQIYPAARLIINARLDHVVLFVQFFICSPRFIISPRRTTQINHPTAAAATPNPTPTPTPTPTLINAALHCFHWFASAASWASPAARATCRVVACVHQRARAARPLLHHGGGSFVAPKERTPEGRIAGRCNLCSFVAWSHGSLQPLLLPHFISDISGKLR